MADVLLTQTNDGGEICFDDAGNIELTGDLRSSTYISLFGGGGDWWADINEPDSNDRLTGELGRLVKSIPPSASNLQLLEDAGERDLNWMLNIGAASKTDVSASLTNINRLTIVVNLEYDGGQVELKYSLNWTTSHGSTSNTNN